MASQRDRAETRLRITDGLLVIVLAVVSVIMIWTQTPDALTGILLTLAAAGVLVLGVTIVVGRTRAGRMVLTRRRWKYGLLIGVIVVFTFTAIFLKRPVGNPGLALIPIVVGLFVAQLFESEAVAGSTMGAAIDRDIRTWTRILLVAACAGVVLCFISVVAAAVGNLVLVSLLLPLAILFLLFAVVIWVRLRSNKRQPKGSR